MANRRNGPTVREFTDVTKALGDPNRVRILAALRSRELCVCQVVELLDLAPSTVSKHISILRQADLVECRKDGRWAYYRRSTEGSAASLAALEWLDAAVTSDAQVREDRGRLREILKKPPEELCRGMNRIR